MPWHTEPAKNGLVFVVDDKGKRYSEKPIPKWRAKKQMAALNINDPQKKEASLDKQIQTVVSAITQKLNPPQPAYDPMKMEMGYWVKEVYSDYAIVCSGDKMYQVDYTMNADGTVDLGDPVEVEMTWQPVGKAVARYTHKETMMKDGLPASAFLIVEDPQKTTTWHLPVKDSAGKADHTKMGGAWAALHGGYRGQKYEGPGKAEAIAKLKKLYDAEKMSVPGEKGFRTIKQADGSYRWVLFSSSTFRDRDGEIIKQKALEEDVDRCDASGSYGPLRWWHMGNWEYPDGPESWQTWKAADGIDLGDCDFNMLHGKILIESGTFKDPVIAKAISEIEDDLEVSITFSHPMDEPGKTKEYNNIHRLERSLLPAGVASNLLTRVYTLKGEPDMLKAKEKLAALVAIVKNQPELVTKILADAEAVQKAAEAAGLESKEVSEMLESKDSPVDAPADAPADTPADAPADAPADTPAEDVIGDMSRMDLALFVQEVIKQSLPQHDATAVAKQAAQDQQVADALVALKTSGERLATAESTIKEIQASLLELTDSRPAGIKQLQNQRPTTKSENIIAAAPTGPQMDPAFVKLVRGGS